MQLPCCWVLLYHCNRLSQRTWNWKMWNRINDWYQEVIIDLFALRKYVSSPLGEITLSLAHAVLHCSPLCLPVPFVTAPRIAHSHWSSYRRAIFHISHIRSPYLSCSAWARHAKLIQAPTTCAEFSDRRSQRCEIHIDFIRYSVFACNRIRLIPFPITQEITWGYTLLINEKVELYVGIWMYSTRTNWDSGGNDNCYNYLQYHLFTEHLTINWCSYIKSTHRDDKVVYECVSPSTCAYASVCRGVMDEWCCWYSNHAAYLFYGSLS